MRRSSQKNANGFTRPPLAGIVAGADRGDRLPHDHELLETRYRLPGLSANAIFLSARPKGLSVYHQLTTWPLDYLSSAVLPAL
jgi:hypothetical protein